MRALVIGAAGYVGTAICRKFLARGYETHGLARSDGSRESLELAGIAAVAGDFSDLPGIRRLVRDFDTVILAAPVAREQEPAAASAILDGLQAAGGDRRFIFTSGTGVISHDGHDGAWNPISYSDYDEPPFPRTQTRALRVSAEDLARRSAGDGLNATVIRPPLIYGHGASSQVPAIFDSIRKTGAACYIGKGLNLYSNVHVDDLAEAYCLIVERGIPGALYHTVAGEANFRAIAEAAAAVAGCGTRSVDYEEACQIWGMFYTANALAVNSRTTSPRASAELGWKPVEIDVIEDIRHGSYAEAWAKNQGKI